MRTEARRIARATLGVAGFVLCIARPVAADLVQEVALTRALAEAMAGKLLPRPAVVVPSGPHQARVVPAARSSIAPSAYSGDARRDALEQLIDETALRHGVRPAFVHAIVAAESGYDPRARSPKGAIGLMQLMPGTASDLGVRDPWDPAANVDGGVRFLAELLAEFGNAELALVGYNAGPEVVRRRWRIPEETRVYVRSVMSHFRRLRDAQCR